MSIANSRFRFRQHKALIFILMKKRINILKYFLQINHHMSSEGATKSFGGRPVEGSVPFARRNSKMWGYGL